MKSCLFIDKVKREDEDKKRVRARETLGFSELLRKGRFSVIHTSKPRIKT